MRRPFKIFPLLIMWLLAPPFISNAGQYEVIRVVDGDTIVVNYNGIPEKVRFLCVNTPESVHHYEKQNIPMGTAASDYTKKRLWGKYVDLEFEGPFQEMYGRLFAYVFLDGHNFNLELVRKGLSPYYTKYGHSQKYHQSFKKAENMQDSMI